MTAVGVVAIVWWTKPVIFDSYAAFVSLIQKPFHKLDTTLP